MEALPILSEKSTAMSKEYIRGGLKEYALVSKTIQAGELIIILFLTELRTRLKSLK